MRGIRTALDLRDADPALVRKLLTIRGSNIQMELQGIPAIGEDIPLTHSCIISSRSLGYDARAIEPILEAAAIHAARGAPSIAKVMVILADPTDPEKEQAGLFDFAHRGYD